MTDSIFLSYARKDNQDGFVEKLYERLIAEGYDVWWDMQSMPQRQLTFLQEIRDAVFSHSRLLLVASPNAYTSYYVAAEWQYALSICKPVHPILRAGDYPDIPSELSQFDAPNFVVDADFNESFEHLLRHLEEDPAPLGKIHGTRPALPAWYIERDHIMEELDKQVLIDSKQPVVVTSKQQVTAMYGMGGIGKTTVASAFCERCSTQRYFPDGIFWITLGKTPDITFQQANIGRLFGDEPKEYLSPEKGLARLQALLADKRVLFVLDDLWQKDHADYFRLQGDFTRTLITTRQQDLSTQLAAMSIEIDKLTVEEGLRLFDKRLNRDGESLRKHEAIERDIIELLDGYTLAVELASAQLFKKGEDYAPRLLERLQKLNDSDNPFRSLKLEGENKNANIEISLAISYEDLNEDEKRRFRTLGVLAPNEVFPLSLIKSLWGDEDDEDTEDILDRLVNLVLVSRDENGLYEQHTVLRAYAMALSKRASEYDENQYAYLTTVTEVTKRFRQLPPEQWYILKNINPHILYVGDTLTKIFSSHEHFEKIAFRFAMQIHTYISHHVEVHRKSWIEMGLTLAKKFQDIHGQAICLSVLGYLCTKYGDVHESLEHYKNAMSLYHQMDEKAEMGTMYNNIGQAYSILGNKIKALNYYNKALQIQKKYDSERAINTLINIGQTHLNFDDHKTALKYYEEALPLIKHTNNKMMEASLLNGMGQINFKLDKFYEAISVFTRALNLSIEINDVPKQAATVSNIGMAYSSLRNYQQALNHYDKALLLFRQLNDKRGISITLNNIATVHLSLGNDDKAIAIYDEALTIKRLVGDKFGEATTLFNSSMLYYKRGYLEEAIRRIDAALTIAKVMGHPDIKVYKVMLKRLNQELFDNR